MPLADYPVVGVAPDMTEARFVAILTEARSPAASAAPAVYRYCVSRGVSPAALLAIFRHESSLGLAGWAVKTRSWGNTRPPSFGAPAIGWYDQDSGEFNGVGGRALSAYANWVDGGVSTVARLVEHAPYRGKTTVRAIIPVWAPTGNGNVPERYIAAVLADIERWREPMSTGYQVVDKLLKPGVNHWSGRDGHPVEAVVLHVAEGTEAGTTSWFSNPASEASSHYFICKDGRVLRFVREEDTAWTNGKVQRPNLADPLIARWVGAGINPNRRTISVETERFWRERLTPAQLAATAALVADIHRRHGLPTDGSRLLGHNEIDSVDRARCPSLSRAEWDALVAALNAPPPTPPPASDPGFPTLLQPDGRVVIGPVDFGGQAVSVEKVVVQVRNAEGRRYRREWDAHRLNEWEIVE